jgi:L-2,4-diaminobutyrate decarboxylase
MENLRAAFDPELFRREGHRVVDLLATMLTSTANREGPVLPWAPPSTELAHWTERMQAPQQSVADFVAEFAARSIKLHHPRYVGHQVCAPAPGAALAGLASELLNNGMAVYEMGPAANALERWIIRRTCDALGLAPGDGFLTSGGTLGTLTALLAARTMILGEETLERGADSAIAVIASEEGHYCTARAVQVMGWGRAGLVTVPTDARFKLRAELLPEALAEARRRGRRPIAVVASACSTSTGSFDEIHPIADFCAQHGLWLHVDGAHGGAVAFSPELRGRLAGIERADSTMVDFHKLLLTPALATAVLFREPAASWAAFHQRAQYLFGENESDPWRDSGRRTYECTKLSMSAKIAAIWRAHGEQVFVEHLHTVHALARDFAGLVRARPPFALAVEPESNIVCFRLQPPELAAAATDALNASIRRRLIESGRFYLVQTTLRGRVWLRTALMNPFTTRDDLIALLDAIEAEARA